MFSYHWILGREFSYSRTLSTLALLNYLSLASIYFLHTSLTFLATFISIISRVGKILEKEDLKNINPAIHGDKTAKVS